MESEFILSQVKSLKSVVATNLKQVHNKRVTMENVCLHPELVMHQVDALEEVMRDSILLYESGGNRDKFLITNTEFSLDQLAKVRTALEDSAKLQNAPHDSNIKLTTMGPSFVLGVVKTLEEVIRNNSAEMQANTDLRKLCMSQPVFVTKMVGWFHRLMYAHVSLLTQFATLRDTHALGNDALVESKQEVERLASIEKTAAARIAELEASLEKFHEDNVLAKEAEGTAKVRMNKVASQLESLQSVHFGCERKLEERDGEILQLKEECKKLIQMHREAADVALSAAQKAVVRNDELKPLQSERDQLFAELTQLKASFETFQHSHAQEHDHIMAENTQLQDSLRERVSLIEELEVKNAVLNQLVEKLREELRTVQTQLNTSEIHCDTFRAALDDVLSRQTAEFDDIRRAATAEREENEATTNELLQNASRKIEDLENKLHSKDEELTRLREAVARNEKENKIRSPISPPPSAHSSVPPVGKRKAAGRDTNVSWFQEDTKFAVNLAAHGSPMPLTRLQELARLPEVAADLGSPDAVPAIFTRQSLSNILGGSIQGLVVRCTESATDLARRHNMQDYLCPNMDHNAWSPAGPGKHGYMQVGLGRDRKLFNDQGEYRHVFVGAGKLFLYCGWYHVLRVDALTEDEWGTLPDKVKSTYSETTVNKEKSDRLQSAGQVLAMYNSGELRAPCVRLQCVGFDTAFYQELVRANDQFYSNKPRPGPPGNSAKRRKIGGDQPKDEDEDKTKRIAAPGSSDAGPSRWLSESPLTTIARNTRAISQQQESSKSGRLTLRIPSRRATQSPAKSLYAQVKEAEVEMELSESESDHDDLYLDE